jgi:hypothetical protein
VNASFECEKATMKAAMLRAKISETPCNRTGVKRTVVPVLIYAICYEDMIPCDPSNSMFGGPLSWCGCSGVKFLPPP